MEKIIILRIQESSEICTTLSNFVFPKTMRKHRCSIHIQDNKFNEVLYLASTS